MTFDFSCPPPSPEREVIDALMRPSESAAVLALCEEARLAPESEAKVRAFALNLVEKVRAKRTRASGVDALMREFSLSSDEGIALMCLAEALLRIPDAATRDALIRDKIGKADWQAHLGQSPSLFVNAASWGLLLTGKLVATHSQDSLGAALTRLLGKGGEPVIRKAVDLAMRMLGRQFVTGETIEDAIENGEPNLERGYRYSYDMLGEAALTAADAKRYLAAYRHAILAIGKSASGKRHGVKLGPGISIKLSALHPRYQRSQRMRVMRELLPVLKSLALSARECDIGLNIDAEESERLDLSLDLLEALAGDAQLAGWDGLGFVVQAYSKRAPAIIDWIIALARSHRRRVMVRLVKGAYWDSEIKRAQIEGQSDYPVYTRKVHTDVAYQACARRMLAATDALYPQFATHNAYSLAWVRQAAIDARVADTDFEFQCLHGMGETLYDQVIDSHGIACRIYAPVGSHETLLAYLVRRLLENGANSSFVNRIVDANVPLSELASDPVARTLEGHAASHPRIALPRDLYAPLRINSGGLDLACETRLREIEQQLNAFASHRWLAAPTHGVAARAPTTLANPADHTDIVGSVIAAHADDVDSAVARALGAQAGFAATSGAQRAAVLDRAAAYIEEARIELCALLMREAGKSFANALGEVREAADFCRYYAAQVRDMHAVEQGAPLVCISPWNFPLAIFTGQVVAALAAGRCVLAKPAEQTPLVAALATSLLHRAGIATDVLQLLPGDGESVGAPLVAHAHIGGVLFTGSTAVAKGIARTLSKRLDDPVLVAETGGVNAMLVDSSALAEQVTQDVLASAFDSAGQRCSALRLLCIQDDAAQSVLDMLYGAFAELSVGATTCYANDIGPVIDREAYDRLEAHIASMRARGFRVTRLALGERHAQGTFVAPTIIEIPSVASLPGEVFGPVLHVVRYRAEDWEGLLEDINRTGFGLTMGVHSRIDEHIERVRLRANVGNLYVNRNMIGAVVGVQPFGGEGLSGTGPKAGGPLYLARLGVALALSAPTQLAHAQRNVSLLLRRCLQGATPEEQGEMQLFAKRLAQFGLNELLLELKGPTGEENLLRFHPRAVIACLGASPKETLKLAIMATSVGATPLALREHIDGALHDMIGPLLDDSAIDALLVNPHTSERERWQTRLADRPGAIIPVIVVPASANDIGPGHVARLYHERSISINTAAAGGNAALMVLEDV